MRDVPSASARTLEHGSGRGSVGEPEHPSNEEPNTVRSNRTHKVLNTGQEDGEVGDAEEQGPDGNEETESNGSREVAAGVPVGVVPGSQVGSDTHLDEREEGHETEDN